MHDPPAPPLLKLADAIINDLVQNSAPRAGLSFELQTNMLSSLRQLTGRLPELCVSAGVVRLAVVWLASPMDQACEDAVYIVKYLLLQQSGRCQRALLRCNVLDPLTALLLGWDEACGARHKNCANQAVSNLQMLLRVYEG